MSMWSSANRFYHSRVWRDLRWRAINRAGRRCEACGRLGGILNVHHREPVRYARDGSILNRESSLDLNNLECLCVKCHGEHHAEKNIPPRQRRWRESIARLFDNPSITQPN